MGGASAVWRGGVVAVFVDDLLPAARIGPDRTRLTREVCGVVYELFKPEEPLDTEELAAHAAEALEAYRRAPWTGLADRIRVAKLRLAKRLIGRILRFEDARLRGIRARP